MNIKDCNGVNVMSVMTTQNYSSCYIPFGAVQYTKCKNANPTKQLEKFDTSGSYPPPLADNTTK